MQPCLPPSENSSTVVHAENHVDMPVSLPMSAFNCHSTCRTASFAEISTIEDLCGAAADSLHTGAPRGMCIEISHTSVRGKIECVLEDRGRMCNCFEVGTA